MIVFGIGLPRTGTSSLRTAMEILGFEVITDPYGKAYSALEAGNIESLINGENTYISEPAYAFIPEITLKYPDALFIDTPRSFNYWEKSLTKYWGSQNKPVKEGFRVENNYCRKIMNSFKDGYLLPDLSRAWTEHDRQVQECVPLFKLLRLRVCEGEGWRFLCPFLGYPPRGLSHIKFPRKNKS